MTILLVEDESRLAAALIELFHAEKYLADHADNGEDGLYAALQKDYDVIVLDVMLPKMDGFAVVHALRRAGKETPVLMLTARDEIRDKIEGLDRGADDYMTKPFVPEELLARVRALSRRRGEVLLDELRFGDFCLSLATNELAANGKTVRLAFKEAELLKLLVANKERFSAKRPYSGNSGAMRAMPSKTMSRPTSRFSGKSSPFWSPRSKFRRFAARAIA